MSMITLILICCSFCSTDKPLQATHLPDQLKGRFVDDYGITYNINDSIFAMGKSARFHILQLNEKDQFILTKNDSLNAAEQGLYTRIDYMNFSNMGDFTWGYCFTVFDAKTEGDALLVAKADRNNPKKGCNGYPFSRMKRVEKN